jgi:hypothetical protein
MTDIISMLILFPSSMARIWRHGQKRPCFIYRFLSTGTIEEAIFQRQGFKVQLSDSVIEDQSLNAISSDSFSAEELKKIMAFYPHTDCQTHSMICKSGCTVAEHISRLNGFVELEDDFADLALSSVAKRSESISFVISTTLLGQPD